MNKCVELDIQEMLPDLLHGRLDADARARVEAHVASCGECTEELEVLSTVKAAAVFVPTIDVDRVARQIPPYRTIVPTTQKTPARSRLVSWLVAASFVVVVLGGGSLLMLRQTLTVAPLVRVEGSGQPADTGPIITPNGAVNSTASAPHALALASAVDGLSDNNLRQLMNDLNSFDALPATEPGPAITVDNSDSLDQGSR